MEEVVEQTHEIVEEIVIIEECLEYSNDDPAAANAELVLLISNKTSTFHLNANGYQNVTDGRKGQGNRPIQKPCKITSGWKCPKFGRHPHPSNCRKYIQCTFGGENSVYTCGLDEAYDPKANRCTDDWATCGMLSQCKFDRELLIDPYDRNGYFICVRQRGKKNRFRVYRRQCPRGKIFDVVRQRCVSS